MFYKKNNNDNNDEIRIQNLNSECHSNVLGSTIHETDESYFRMKIYFQKNIK
jgi:hypothetical protein